MIKYLGSKRLLLDDIYDAIRGPEVKTVLDVFSGTSRVGHFIRGSEPLQVIANDAAEYAYVVAVCYIQADKHIWQKQAEELIASLNEVQPEPGWFTQEYSEKSKFFQPENTAKVEAIRNKIEQLDLDLELKCIALTSLMEAADRVDSTCGVQMAYLKSWAPRSYKPLKLRVPELVVGLPGFAFNRDALDFAKRVQGDAAYLDPPYNQHSYLGNYHIWETLCKWDKPEVYGKARKRIDVKERKSDYNSKRKAKAAFTELVNALQVRKLVVSFNDEGFISKEEMEEILGARGEVQVITKDYKRYVGAQIGIHNPQGEKVGNVSHLRNKEYIYIVETC